MILDALVNQLNQRFQHEKRAQVCLWFDERREFARLLPALRERLAGLKSPPFRLFEYNEGQLHGQVWLKHQVWRALQATEPSERRTLRFVLYLPVTEDRLEHAGPGGEPALDLLAEYAVAGVTWRIGGKRPTLFAFLRQAGVSLPDNATEQRHLYDGGANSLLAKYVAKFADRPAVFWTATLTPEIAQSRLIGDVDQTLLDLAVDPEGSWNGLRENGLDREFLAIVQERYGFVPPTGMPADWIRGLVAMLALTETYLGYGEPADFPFADRLPPVALRPHHVQLLHRWLRDTESRVAWDRWVREVETNIDLSSWAKGRQGLSFGFPHLVRLRWEEVQSSFEQAAPKVSATAKFFEQHRELIAKEAEFAKASYAPMGAWALLHHLDVFLSACADAQGKVAKLDAAHALARAYVDASPSVELEHMRIRYQAEEHNLPAVTRVADRAYAAYANAINTRFFQALVASGVTEIPGFPPVTEHLEHAIWRGKGKRAVIIVDALRYDCAIAIKELLREQNVEIEPIVAVLPTVTPIGMTSLMPISGASVTLEVKGNTIHPKVDGRDMSVRAERIAYLTTFGASCREIGELEAESKPSSDFGDLLVVFGHDEVDSIGHGEAQTLIRHVQIEVERLARLIRKLHRWGYTTVHVVTDHGFILLDEEKLPEEVPCDKDWCHVRKERFALVPAHADLPVATFPLPWDSSMRVAVPPGLAFFTAEKSFSHGGATLQELIIPHLVSKVQTASGKRIGVEVVLPTFELMRTAVKVVLRAKSPEPEGVQMPLFGETIGRSLVLDVRRVDGSGQPSSVLASGPKEVKLEPKDQEQAVTLFFRTSASFSKGELLELDIRDVDTSEQFPPGGIKLTVGRDM